MLGPLVLAGSLRLGQRVRQRRRVLGGHERKARGGQALAPGVSRGAHGGSAPVDAAFQLRSLFAVARATACRLRRRTPACRRTGADGRCRPWCGSGSTSRRPSRDRQLLRVKVGEPRAGPGWRSLWQRDTRVGKAAACARRTSRCPRALVRTATCESCFGSSPMPHATPTAQRPARATSPLLMFVALQATNVPPEPRHESIPQSFWCRTRKSSAPGFARTLRGLGVALDAWPAKDHSRSRRLETRRVAFNEARVHGRRREGSASTPTSSTSRSVVLWRSLSAAYPVV